MYSSLLSASRALGPKHVTPPCSRSTGVGRRHRAPPSGLETAQRVFLLLVGQLVKADDGEPSGVPRIRHRGVAFAVSHAQQVDHRGVEPELSLLTADGLLEPFLDAEGDGVDFALREKIGATGTPATVIIDNLTGEKEFVPGAQNSQAFVQVMKRMLQESVDKEAKAQAEAAGEKPKDALDQVMKQVTPQAAEAPAEASPQ